ncbi:phenylalanyl-tRNA synthetase beta subunit [Panacagrimonas perspica]|uniref:Phenylalanine--tRNA ligase beta subunit n=1 Tax=Panacagrimonas perspica TaxID=381431 RepID=A0A4R7PEW1_9GAMM|nr:phenylalanine--tRNA ligase subunit beta [Panacagrimonas perspica]TDU32734.1 phenylalanyl-tRNA synthetase beta subunit [Panacagrimonas perspica]THD05614.1 phenylalanine--tRNA ligase subunit beta [Panacagrimonas perspica]
MKLSEQWLREWVNPSATIEQIAERLVMGGLELEIEPVCAELPRGVVVGRIVSIAPHPNAERLRVCEVDVGASAKSTIVCGAANARAGMVAPVALPGARLPGGLEIKASALRGVESAGMLCSASELGLAEKSEGLLELDADARPGTPIEKHLALDDKILNLEITPNRGDCLSVVGLAREVAALYGVNVTRPRAKQAVVVGEHRHSVEIESPADCSAYAGRVMYGLNARARTPDAMRERLRRSGIRSIQPLVDVTNYVMMELGQPMHAFDASRLVGTVRVRRAKAGESLTLLNDQPVELNNNELLICDDSGPVALAGVMGGASTAVSGSTTRVFFESACFAMNAVAGTGRRHKLASDALYRFERGVDPELQRAALERATELTAQICGGEAGPVTFTGRPLPEVRVKLRHARLNKLLGQDIAAKDVEALLARLSITTRNEVGGTWSTQVPSWRYDLRIEADLIEEVARLFGYDRIPAKPYAARIAPGRPSESQRSLASLKNILAARGWQEIISLAFADRAVQERLAPDAVAIPLDNPIADNLALMRSTLWCGLLDAWRYNHARQMPRLRLFEAGVCFTRVEGAIAETPRIAGLIAGPALPEQWGAKARGSDFYDLKAEVQALFGRPEDFRFEAAEHPALHPGRSARISCDGQAAGWIGELHPALVTDLGLPSSALVFELSATVLQRTEVPRARPVPEFPASRRDLALVVPESISLGTLQEAVRAAAPPSLRDVFVFDVYRGENLGTTFKSMALGLIFQDYSRTLTDVEIDSAMARINAEVAEKLGASGRS